MSSVNVCHCALPIFKGVWGGVGGDQTTITAFYCLQVAYWQLVCRDLQIVHKAFFVCVSYPNPLRSCGSSVRLDGRFVCLFVLLFFSSTVRLIV